MLAKELTKIHESFYRGTAEELLKLCENIKGEFVIVIEGKTEKRDDKLDFLNNLDVKEHFKFYANQGLEKKEIIKKIAKDRNVPKNEIYKKFL